MSTEIWLTQKFTVERRLDGVAAVDQDGFTVVIAENTPKLMHELEALYGDGFEAHEQGS